MHVVIIGNGISGVTVARHLRKNSDCKITLVSAESEFFFSRTALMYVYMGHMKFENLQPYENGFWSKNNINLVNDRVITINYDGKVIILENGDAFHYDKLVLAVGSKPNKFGWPGENLKAVQGLYHKHDLESMEGYSSNTNRAVIVGGGLIGIEMAEMFLSRGIKVTMLVRESSFWNSVLPLKESQLVTKHILEHHVDLRLGVELKEILSDEKGRARAVLISNGEEISCEFVGLTTGVTPNVDFLKESELELDRGVMINQYLETNIDDVYALGDCAQFRESIGKRRPIEQVWYTGKIMGEVLATTILGERKKYAPGHWFNSAKFFDIEYQTYGWVGNSLGVGEDEYYWEHKGGKICIHFVFDKQTHELIGVNSFGIRLRHELFDRWLTDRRTIEYVLKRLRDANFDPEFYKQYELEIVDGFNFKFGTSIHIKHRSWRRIFNLSRS